MALKKFPNIRRFAWESTKTQKWNTTIQRTASGRLRTLIVRGQAWEISTKAQAVKPAYFDVLPLSLEEIFIYELGGVNDAVKNILL